MARSFPLRIAPSHGGIWTHLLHDSLGPSEPTTQMALDWLSHFCTAHLRVSLYFTMGRLPPPSPLSKSVKIAHSHSGCGPPSNTWFLGPNWVLNPVSVQPFMQSHYCDRPTDHATRLVTVGHIYIHSTGMRPNNCWYHCQSGSYMCQPLSTSVVLCQPLIVVGLLCVCVRAITFEWNDQIFSMLVHTDTMSSLEVKVIVQVSWSQEEKCC